MYELCVVRIPETVRVSLKRLYVLCVLGKIVSVRFTFAESPWRLACVLRRSSVLATTEHGMEHGHKHGGTRICRSATCTHVSHHTRQRRHRATLISHHCSHHRITGTGSHILIVYTTYTAVNDTIAVDPSRIPASARAHRGSGARLHRSPPHTHTAADRVGTH